MKSISVFSGDNVGHFPPENATEFMAWFSYELMQIPAEYRHTARVILDTETSYGESRVTLEIRYSRPETDEEKAASEAARERVAKEEEALRLAQRLAAERREALERRMLAKLKAKYES